MIKSNKRDYVYCSGPLFCPEEIGGMTAIAKVLEDEGYGTFLPHRDGIENYVMKYVNSPINVNIFKSRDLIDRAIFALDIYQIIVRCEYFVFNMNGRVPDEGGVAETAIAYAAGKPIVIYKNDSRTVFNGNDNSMITGLSSSPKISDINSIPKELKKVSKQFKKLGKSPYTGNNIPLVMQDTLSLGAKIWKILNVLNLKSREEKSTSDLINEIAMICRSHPSLC